VESSRACDADSEALYPSSLGLPSRAFWRYFLILLNCLVDLHEVKPGFHSGESMLQAVAAFIDDLSLLSVQRNPIQKTVYRVVSPLSFSQSKTGMSGALRLLGDLDEGQGEIQVRGKQLPRQSVAGLANRFGMSNCLGWDLAVHR
jgi:hypothetical protein